MYTIRLKLVLNVYFFLLMYDASVYLDPSGSIDTDMHPSVDGLGLEIEALFVWPFPAVAADPLLVTFIHICLVGKLAKSCKYVVVIVIRVAMDWAEYFWSLVFVVVFF